MKINGTRGKLLKKYFKDFDKIDKLGKLQRPEMKIKEFRVTLPMTVDEYQVKIQNRKTMMTVYEYQVKIQMHNTKYKYNDGSG